jgi:hypothetical protein
MKLSSLAFAAWMVLGHLAAAQDTASSGAASTTTLPLQVPASARNAAEAPRWDAAPASAINLAAQPPDSGSNLNVLPQTNSPAAAPNDAAVADQQPKQLPSVMKRGSATIQQDSGVLPATYNAPPGMNGVVPAAGAAVVGAPVQTAGAVNPAQAAAIGSNPPGFLPAVQASGISPAAAPAPIANTNRSLPPTSAAPAAPPAVRENPVDPEKLAASRAAGDLLASSIDYGTAGTTPLRLIDVLAQTTETDRAAAVREYWNLARAWSDYRWAIDESKRFDTIVPARGAVDAPMLSTARAAATARVNDAQLNVESAQAALMRTARLAPQAGSYFPTDAPLVGPYQTFFAVLFAGRPSPGRTWQIDRALPIRLKTINDRTAAVQSAASAVHYAEEAHARGEVDLRTVLACHDELHQQRRAFLDAVHDYNADIAEYAATLAGAAAPDRLVAMLIHVKPAERVSAIPGRPGGTIQLPAPPSALGAGAPNTRSPANGRPAAITSNDGWVPSASRSAEPTNPPANQSPVGSMLPGSTGGQSDPFSAQR